MAVMRTLVVLALGALATSIPILAEHEVAGVTACSAPAESVCGPATASARVAASRANASAAQDPSADEAALGLDRPTRRLIQRGLRNEGFDPGAPDGLFGPRTRAVIRRWQTAEGHPTTGYLDRTQADDLRAAAAPPYVVPERPGADSSPAVELSPTPAPAAVNCEEWNTEPFFESATASVVTACLAAGVDVAARDDDRITPLHWAAWSSRDPAVIKALLTAGADLEARNDNSRTPLHNAAANSNPAVLQVLLDAGGSAETRTTNGLTFLHYAAQLNDNPAVIEALLAAGADLEARDDGGFTPLHRAAWTNENPAVLESLLVAGADVGAPNDSGSAPIQNAAFSNGNPAVLEALLAAGADRNAQSRDGRTLLHLAAQNNENPVVIEFLLAAGADIEAQDRGGRTPLQWAASDNENLGVIEALLAAGADSEVLDGLDRALIHHAAENENPAVVEALLAGGADPMARDSSGYIRSRTPLHRAAQSNENPAVVEALLAGGADPMARDSSGYTPLHGAAQSNENPAVVEALLAAGADLMARDSRGQTPLHWAARNNENPAVVEALLAAGADLETRNRRGETPLHHAAHGIRRVPQVPKINRLVEAGASLDARDEDGNTPLHLAAQYVDFSFDMEARARNGDPLPRDSDRFQELLDDGRFPHGGDRIEALLDVGADPTAQNAEGRTPWDLADENDYLRGSDAYWRLNDARFNPPRQDSRRPPATQPARPQAVAGWSRCGLHPRPARRPGRSEFINQTSDNSVHELPDGDRPIVGSGIDETGVGVQRDRRLHNVPNRAGDGHRARFRHPRHTHRQPRSPHGSVQSVGPCAVVRGWDVALSPISARYVNHTSIRHVLLAILPKLGSRDQPRTVAARPSYARGNA